jgi:hypothetical protein
MITIEIIIVIKIVTTIIIEIEIIISMIEITIIIEIVIIIEIATLMITIVVEITSAVEITNMVEIVGIIAIMINHDPFFDIPLNPNFVEAFSNRVLAYDAKGQYDRDQPVEPFRQVLAAAQFVWDRPLPGNPTRSTSRGQSLPVMLGRDVHISDAHRRITLASADLICVIGCRIHQLVMDVRPLRFSA